VGTCGAGGAGVFVDDEIVPPAEIRNQGLALSFLSTSALRLQYSQLASLDIAPPSGTTKTSSNSLY
jgi:hypothetical protein